MSSSSRHNSKQAITRDSSTAAKGSTTASTKNAAASNSESAGSNSIELAWENFFRSCELPQKVSKLYAKRFVKERMQFYMLKEITKEELKELGIEALGDQLSIIRHIKGVEGKEFRPGGAVAVDEDFSMDTSETTFKSPDRDEIYHIRMPEGRTERTRGIMERHEELRTQGLIKRGTTGVRVGGRDVRITGGSGTTPVMIHDVTSSSAPVLGAMRGMAADAISLKTRVVNEGKKGATTGSLVTTLANRGRQSQQQQQETNFIIRLDSATTGTNRRQITTTEMDIDDDEMNDSASLAEEDIDAIVRQQGQLQLAGGRVARLHQQQAHSLSSAARTTKPLSARFVVGNAGGKGRRSGDGNVTTIVRKPLQSSVAVVSGVGGRRPVVAQGSQKRSRLSANQLQRLLLAQHEPLFDVEQVPLVRPIPASARPVITSAAKAGSGQRKMVLAGKPSGGGRIKPVVTMKKSIISRVQIGGRPLQSGGRATNTNIASRISIVK